MPKTYSEKRNFSNTPEPSGENGQQRDDNAPFFVVQKHEASSLHYDFRLAHNGTLKSWAVPKGPSLKPAEKRLAIQVEDHPLDYADFEGVIPEGEYGGGTVLIWDRGGFEPHKDMDEGLKKGRLQFALDGEKLKGDFELVRFREKEESGDQWLLIKHKDEHARDGCRKAITKEAPDSVVSQRSLKEVAEAAQQNATDDSGHEEAEEQLDALDGSRERGLPDEQETMHPTLVDDVPRNGKWLHEIKWDGYRLLIEKRDGKLRLLTRQRKDWTERFPEIAEAADALCEEDFLIDGEAVVLDSKGRSDFQGLQNRLKGKKAGHLRFYAFDVLYLCHHDLRKTPLAERKQVLQHWLHERAGDRIAYSDHIESQGEVFYEHACREQLEGIVSKRPDSTYTNGRTKQWLKVKCSQRQEFVIVGYTDPGGSRKHFGSLVLAAHNDEGKLTYAGRVGTGFDQQRLEDIGGKLERLRRKTSPLEKGEQHLSKDVHWVTPKLVGEVEFTELTNDGLLRHPSFKGLREDKPASEVRLEIPADPDQPTESADSTAASNAKGDNKPPDAVLEEVKEETTSNGSGNSAEPNYHGITITHPDREIDPDSGLTKGDLCAYYAKAAPHLMPFIEDRPLSLVRCPQGRQKSCFFQKHFKDSAPEQVETIELEEKKGRAPYAYLREESGVVALAQFGAIEFHGWGCRRDKPDKPDRLIFDLDPGEEVEWKEILGAAFLMRDLLDELGLTSLPKLTGGKGIHVCVPLARRADWDAAKTFAHRLASRVAEQNPKKFIAKSTKSARKGKVFIDYLRNGYGATAVEPFSVRARPNLPISVPLDWDELDPAIEASHWTIANINERLKTRGASPWDAFRSTRQTLTKKRLESVESI
ncbi:MAG: DNA ligase D [Verrucomicrobiota bacterium]